jgi:hypothetical protein
LPLTSALFLAASAAVEIFFLKKMDQIYNKIGRLELLGQRMGALLGKCRPPWRPPPPPTTNALDDVNRGAKIFATGHLPTTSDRKAIHWRQQKGPKHSALCG